MRDTWRKLIHVLVHLLIAWSIMAAPTLAVEVGLSSLALGFLAFDIARLCGGGRINTAIRNLFGDVIRPWEYHRLSAPTWSFVTLSALVWASTLLGFPRELVAVSSLCLAFGDPAASIARMLLPGQRSLVLTRIVGIGGSLPAIVAVALYFSRLYPEVFTGNELTVAILVSLAASLSEALSWKYVDDNATLPLASVIALLAILGFDLASILGVCILLLATVVAMLFINNDYVRTDASIEASATASYKLGSTR